MLFALFYLFEVKVKDWRERKNLFPNFFAKVFLTFGAQHLRIMAANTASKKHRRPAKGKKPDVKPDYKSINFKNISLKMGPHNNLYPRLMLFARGVNDSVTPEILNEFLTVLDTEIGNIKTTIRKAISELEKAT